MKYQALLFIIMFFPIVESINAQNFKENFKDSTLRIDYIFSGNTSSQSIAVDKLNVMPRWYGKTSRLSEVPVEGNGQITVTDYKTGEALYKNSFSTLFQEWLTYDEAKIISVHLRMYFSYLFQRKRLM